MKFTEERFLKLFFYALRAQGVEFIDGRTTHYQHAMFEVMLNVEQWQADGQPGSAVLPVLYPTLLGNYDEFDQAMCELGRIEWCGKPTGVSLPWTAQRAEACLIARTGPTVRALIERLAAVWIAAMPVEAKVGS